jgi:hypothetical protein
MEATKLLKNTVVYFSNSCFVHFFLLTALNGSRDSVVGTATGYGLDDRGVRVRVPVGSRIFSSPRHLHRFCGPPNLLSNEYRGLSPGLKWQGREADHSLPVSVEVKKIWICTSTPSHAFMS